ncbi:MULTISPECIES: Fe(3+) ABC transporter substrate-binding protein [unclassified Virgibacillus]|uniref:Fe(3+) ABC transporter substrate-binding protein n=1 Tax=unclassified Virgibacillus TaxID=2620237 RepID=UPI0024DE9539|nr:Fe(3+) ABC transporter substrate-binding protein [Virgibacillus sp. LDC-1]
MRKTIFFFSFIFLIVLLSACGNQEDTSDDSKNKNDASSEEVNLYTSRHYDIDDELYNQFEEKTGIKVNVIEGSADELIERMKREGDQTADLFYTADAGRLHRAKEQGLLQSVENDVLNKNIPENLRDADNEWFGLTKRARVIVYHKDRVDLNELSTYEDLTDPKWEGRILIRSSENIYNQSLLASFIDLNGRDEAKTWAEAIVANMARDPQGGDRDQAKGVAAGEGDIAVMNTYYLGGMLNSADEAEVNVAKQLEVFFPNQDTTGTHVNVSGIGITKQARNKENAVKLIEFLSSEDVQAQFASANYEYPVNPNVEPDETLKQWGDFKEQDINLSILGENNTEAVKIFNEVGWK